MEWKPFNPNITGPNLHGKYLLLRIRDALGDYPRLVTYNDETHAFHCHSHCQLTLRQFNRITHYCLIDIHGDAYDGFKKYPTVRPPLQNTMDADTRRG